MGTRLGSILLLVRSVEQSARFYGSEGLGLSVRFMSDNLAELQTHPSALLPPLLLQQATREADCTTGYSPFLCFLVDDVAATVPKLIAQGAALDGPIKYPPSGPAAALRSPDGHMFTISEPLSTQS